MGWGKSNKSARLYRLNTKAAQQARALGTEVYAIGFDAIIVVR
jgi:hypothetical protein